MNCSIFGKQTNQYNMDVAIPFESLSVSEDWTFKNVKSTEQWTHGYHRYPAKFLPNIVKKIIEDYTKEGDVVADLFAGCGTTLVESKIHGRKSVGVDINPVAQLIARVKTQPIDPKELDRVFKDLVNSLEFYDEKNYHNIEKHDRIDYWFFPENKYRIAYLYDLISGLPESQKIKDFFLVALSHILKNCSRWLQTSTKPQIDPDKVPVSVFFAFKKQVKTMIRKNSDFFKELKKLQYSNVESQIFLQDARKTEIEDSSISTVITSPPYVTSYEYADLHQLTGYWFDYVSNLLEFRKNFIGTFYSYGTELKTESKTAQDLIDQLKNIHLRTAKEVANYFNDMKMVADEMYRILKNDGYAFIVIGNTTFKNVKILSAEIFSELLELSGFEVHDVIKRSIPHKLIPTIRDKTTGKFTTVANKNSKKVYPEEYIIIARK
ncbi:DNA methylase N-4/N-6 domain protein [Allomuricauda ruestringensis DSM 13258]|uniref:Methyltransferase n=2 Tax=Flagellimonas TaxID=444459 RepID=G2PLW1_ALLRU|nr:DNA methylase N-4/N-6 domain protein [Allomuricauda ruestringensis DSM 13258]